MLARGANAMRLTLKAIDDELRMLGYDVHLEKGDGYFWKGEANNWLDRTVNVPKVSSLTLAQWIGEFNRLKKERWRSPASTQYEAAVLRWQNSAAAELTCPSSGFVR